MLSLNSVPDNKAQAREISQARPRSANGDERETRPDFQAMVVAAVQPAKIEQQPLRTKEADEIYQQRAPKAETPAPAGSNNSTNEIKGDAIHTPKAGHEAAKAEPTEGESKAKQPAPEASAATTAQTRKSSHDMLQALGLAHINCAHHNGKSCSENTTRRAGTTNQWYTLSGCATAGRAHTDSDIHTESSAEGARRDSGTERWSKAPQRKDWHRLLEQVCREAQRKDPA
jgi:hypothetical protein